MARRKPPEKSHHRCSSDGLSSSHDDHQKVPVNPRLETAPTRTGQAQIVRMHNEQIDSVDDWIKLQGVEISRSEAIRRLKAKK
jgi:hypothetical protein